MGGSAAEQFTNAVVASGVLSAEEVQRLSAKIAADSTADEPPTDGESWAKLLVRHGKLTEFQASRILAGDGESLVLGEYVLLETIGAGGMGQVFKAQHRRMKRLVAVKLLPPDRTRDEDSIRRFQREVEAAAKLVHPNIVVAYDAGEFRGRHFLVMEYVDGRDLSALVKGRGPLPIEQALDYTMQAARGLAFAHGKGVVHRDVKPSNLLLDREGRVKILDLGLARFDIDDAAEEGLTHSGQAMGTADYMAPEQANDTHRADARSDIYSLGCTLYRLLTADPMFKGNTLVSKLMAHQNSPIPDLRARRPDVSPQLEIVFRRMVAKRPEERYQTMNEVVAALQACRAAKASAVLDKPNSDPNATSAWSPSGTTVEEDGSAAYARRPLGAVREETIGSFNAESATAATRSHQPERDEYVRKRHWRNRRVLIVAGAAGFILILAGIIFIIRDKSGREIARVEAPDGSTVGMEAAAAPFGADSNSQISNLKSEWKFPPGAPPPAIAPFDAAKAKEHQAAWAKYLGVPVEMTNSIGMKFVLIPPGEFQMGSTKEVIDEELKRSDSDQAYKDHLPAEEPQHRVQIATTFYLGTYLVTQEEYQRVMGASPSEFSATGKSKDKVAGQDTKRFPVEAVTWKEADEFCSRLSEIPAEKTAGLRYRLPSEAQWEYACRAGNAGRYSFSPGGKAVPKQYDENALVEYGWFNGNSGGTPHTVGLKRPSAWGLYDMHGNVWEWCRDWYHKRYYANSPTVEPAGPSVGSYPVIRGGAWIYPAMVCRSASRGFTMASLRAGNQGFRVSLVLPDKSIENAKPSQASNAAPAAMSVPPKPQPGK